MKFKQWLAISLGILLLGFSAGSFACEICDQDYCSDTWDCYTDYYSCGCYSCGC